MGKSIIISEEEKKKIKSLYESLGRNDSGQITAGNNTYNIFVDGTKRYFGGKTDDGLYNICNKSNKDAWNTICKSVDIPSNQVDSFYKQMNNGDSPIVYKTSNSKEVKFIKV